MTVTVIVGLETEMDHIIEIDCKTTIKDEYRNNYKDDYRYDYTDNYRDDYRKENHRNFKDQKYKRKHRDNYENTYEDRYIDYCNTTYKDSHRDKHRNKYRYESFDSDRGRSREKHCLHNARKDNGLVSSNSKIKQYHRVLQQLSPDKLVAIRFILTSSENFDNMDHFIAEGIEFVKNQKVESLKDDNSSSQNDVNYVNHELIDSAKMKKI